MHFSFFPYLLPQPLVTAQLPDLPPSRSPPSTRLDTHRPPPARPPCHPQLAALSSPCLRPLRLPASLPRMEESSCQPAHLLPPALAPPPATRQPATPRSCPAARPPAYGCPRVAGRPPLPAPRWWPRLAAAVVSRLLGGVCGGPTSRSITGISLDSGGETR
jgi:hypothetical protein